MRTITAVAWALAAMMCWSSSSSAGERPPTFADDIAPLVYANCAICHHEGEAAPFAMLSYADARKHARQMVEVTARRLMPPWKAEAGDVHFVGERRLSDAQIDLLRRWAAAGCPRGEASAEPAAPTFTAGWRLGEPDLVVSMPQAYTLAADGRDVYRCFVIPLSLPKGKYLKAAEFRPGLRRIVHHAVLTTLPLPDVRKKLALEPPGNGPGFSSGLAAPGDRLAGPLGIWVPGKDPAPLPEGFAARIPDNQALVLQLHLHPDGKVEQEQSSVGLYLTSERPIGQVRPIIFFNKNVNIAPGERNFTLRASQTLKREVEVIGLFPHMHLLGRTTKLIATLPSGQVRTLLSISDWDFNWQGYYQPAQPLHLPAGTQLDCSWSFDNSADNPANPSHPPRRVTFGEQTVNEMGALVMDVVETPAAQTAHR